MTRVEAADAAWAALGRQLAASRRAARLSQHELAPLAGYSRSTIANAETGRQHVPRDFWERCDAVVGTGSALARGYDEVAAADRQRQVDDAVEARQARTAAAERARLGPLSAASSVRCRDPKLAGIQTRSRRSG